MNKIMILVLTAVVLMAACQKKDIDGYHGSPNVYFNLTAKDSVLYTFALHPGKSKDTAWVPVRISGGRADKDRSYSVKVIDSSTTAVVNRHYEPFKDSYLVPAGAGFVNLPVVLYNSDTNLLKRAYTMTLQLVPTGDFNTAIKDQLSAKVVFSNRLEKPVWWDRTPGGTYSIVKHQLFRLAATTEEVSLKTENAPIWIYFTARLQALMTSPKTWISNNPDKGYVLTTRTDGTGNQDFYNAQSPDVKFRYEKDPNSGIFYFIDENNQQVK